CPRNQVTVDNRCFAAGVCAFAPCNNGGVCQLSSTDSRRYTCICTASFTGNNCEIAILAAGAGIAAIIALVVLLVLLIILVIIFCCYRKRRRPEAKLLPPDRDLRESVAHYMETAGDQSDGLHVLEVESITYMNPADQSGLGYVLADRVRRLEQNDRSSQLLDAPLDYGYEGSAVYPAATNAVMAEEYIDLAQPTVRGHASPNSFDRNSINTQTTSGSNHVFKNMP
ncbi:hypothetical protein Ciccas_008671, partial [Cichlidogyrus casuarinus]